MKLGISTYCLEPKLASGAMDLPQALRWAADQGAECVELVPFSFSLQREDGAPDAARVREIRETADRAGIELCNYSILADFCREPGPDFEAEVERVCRHVDVVAALGIPRMRHDVSGFRRPRGENNSADYDELLPRMAEGARRVCAYAKARGVATLVENHGFFANGADRVERLLRAVDDENYGLLLDTGNVACVDEDPGAAAVRLSPLARMVHLKDFYIRKRDPGDTTDFDCSGRWFRSMAGRYLRGSIFGQGDLDTREMLSALREAGYDGPIVLEFEGMEDPLYATRVSLDNARRIWAEVSKEIDDHN